MGRRGKRRKFGAAGGEFSQGEFTSPENFKHQWVPAGPSGPVGIGFSVIDVSDNRKVSDFGLVGHKIDTSLGKAGGFLCCRRMNLNAISKGRFAAPAASFFLDAQKEAKEAPGGRLR